MSDCTDSKSGSLLHAYELNALSDTDRDCFEEHLLQCEYCFEEVSEFSDVSTSLRDDPAVLKAFGSKATESSENKTLLARLLDQLWPETSWVWKPAVAYLAIGLLLYPAYLGLRKTDSGVIKQIQTLNLKSTRSSSAEVVLSSEDLLLVFRFHGAEAGKTYRLTLTRGQSDTMFRDYEFDGFDETETGQLLIPAGALKSGEYRLTIEDPKGAPPLNVQEHNFSVE